MDEQDIVRGLTGSDTSGIDDTETRRLGEDAFPVSPGPMFGDLAKGKCTKCERIAGAVGLLAGLVLIFVGADLLTGGALTRVLTGGPRVIEEYESDDTN